MYLNPIHNAEINLEIGTSRTVTVQVFIWNLKELPLPLQRDLLLCSYAAPFATHFHQAILSYTFFLTLHYRCETNTIAPRPVGICFQELVGNLHIKLPCILSPDIPQFHCGFVFSGLWSVYCSEYEGHNTIHSIFRHYFVGVTSVYSNDTVIYISRSIVSGSAGCTFAADGHIFRFHQRDFSTIDTAELYSVCWALTLVVTSRHTFWSAQTYLVP
jgi:hypothetical protein